MECAGNGRARLEPRPVSQPWLTEAVGCAEWTGVPLRALLDEAGFDDVRAYGWFDRRPLEPDATDSVWVASRRSGPVR